MEKQMSNIATANNTLPAVSNNPCGIENNLWIALRFVIYPEAENVTIKTIHDTCQAQGLDVRQKPYHAIKIKEKDVIWPSIALSRIQASKSGQHIGTSEPDFGPVVTASYGGKMITHPEWCKIYIKKVVGNHIAEFVGMAIWRESYKPGNGYAPNTMWSTRIYSQLAKCAEADGLRRAFPDHVSQEPTAEEMEGLNDMKNVTQTPKALGLSERLGERVAKIEEPVVAKNATTQLEPLVPMTSNHKLSQETALDELVRKEMNNEIPSDLHKNLLDHFGVAELQFLSVANAQKCLDRINLYKKLCLHFNVAELRSLPEDESQKCWDRIARENKKEAQSPQEYEDVEHETTT
jgi:phage recombination protein Bet